MQSISAETTPESYRQYLTFEVGGENCGLLLSEVQEVVEYHPITRVPAAAPFVLGVFNLRGTVVPVLDLAGRLGLTARPVGLRSCFLVLREDARERASAVALLCDAVEQVRETAAEDLQEPPSLGTRIPPRLLTAVVNADGRILHLLDMSSLLQLTREGTPRKVAPEPPA
jgi:purine-binding chemotaxis protein CheW